MHDQPKSIIPQTSTDTAEVLHLLSICFEGVGTFLRQEFLQFLAPRFSCHYDYLKCQKSNQMSDGPYLCVTSVISH